MSKSQRRRNRQRRQRRNPETGAAEPRAVEESSIPDADSGGESRQLPGGLSIVPWRQLTDDLAAWARSPEGIALIAIVLAAAVLRFWDLGERAVHHDESLHGYYSWFMAENGGFVHNPLLHGTVQFIATSFVFEIFGASDATLRVLPALLGVIVVALPYLLFRDRMGALGALTASGLLASDLAMYSMSSFMRRRPRRSPVERQLRRVLPGLKTRTARHRQPVPLRTRPGSGARRR